MGYKLANEIEEALKTLDLNQSKLSLNQQALVKGFNRQFKRWKRLSERQRTILFSLRDMTVKVKVFEH